VHGLRVYELESRLFPTNTTAPIHTNGGMAGSDWRCLIAVTVVVESLSPTFFLSRSQKCVPI